MSPDTLNNRNPQATTAEPELLVDTSRMNSGQRAAMEVAESARDGMDASTGFGGRLFLGDYAPELMRPAPMQSPEDQAIGDTLVQKVSAFLAENLDADEVDETRSIPADVFEGLVRLGVFRMKVPREYGGLGLSQVNYNRVIQAIASYCGSTAVLVSAHQSIGVPQPLKMFGTEAQKARYLTRIAAGEISAFALTEPDVGSDPARMTTTATLSADGTHYVLNGEKLWTTNGPIAQLLVVMAQTAPKVVKGRSRPQITAFIVETDEPGVQVLHRCDFMGLRAIHNGVMRFENVKVPAENVLWGEGLGLKLALKTLNTGRLTLPAACTGLGKQCLSIVRRWGQERVQWGHPIGEHEAGAVKISSIAATTFAMEAVTWLTSHWADQGRDVRIEAAMAKLFCSEAAWTIVDQTMQLRGGRGYERAMSLRQRGEVPYPVERMMRDTRINTIIEGTSEIMRLFLAREALDPHLKLAADLMRRGTPLGRKARSGLGLMRFYATWYPRQVIGRRVPRRHRALGSMASHARYIDRTAHRMATTLFHAMARHRESLERRQMLLGHVMDIGTELFAMAAVCQYAQVRMPGTDGAGNREQLADLFCTHARDRIETSFRAVRRDLRADRSLSRRVLDSEFKWLEQGIIPIGPDS